MVAVVPARAERFNYCTVFVKNRLIKPICYVNLVRHSTVAIRPLQQPRVPVLSILIEPFDCDCRTA